MGPARNDSCRNLVLCIFIAVLASQSQAAAIGPLSRTLSNRVIRKDRVKKFCDCVQESKQNELSMCLRPPSGKLL